MGGNEVVMVEHSGMGLVPLEEEVRELLTLRPREGTM